MPSTCQPLPLAHHPSIKQHHRRGTVRLRPRHRGRLRRGGAARRAGGVGVAVQSPRGAESGGGGRALPRRRDGRPDPAPADTRPVVRAAHDAPAEQGLGQAGGRGGAGARRGPGFRWGHGRTGGGRGGRRRLCRATDWKWAGFLAIGGQHGRRSWRAMPRANPPLGAGTNGSAWRMEITKASGEGRMLSFANFSQAWMPVKKTGKPGPGMRLVTVDYSTQALSGA